MESPTTRFRSIGGRSTSPSIDKNRVPEPTARSIVPKSAKHLVDFFSMTARLFTQKQRTALEDDCPGYRRKSHRSSCLRSERETKWTRPVAAQKKIEGVTVPRPRKGNYGLNSTFTYPGYLLLFPTPWVPLFPPHLKPSSLWPARRAANRQNEPIIAVFVIFPGLARDPAKTRTVIAFPICIDWIPSSY